MPKLIIGNYPLNLTKDPFSVDVTISGAKTATNFLRIELHKDGSKSYFGETFNGKDWVSKVDGINYFPVEIKGETKITLQGKIGSDDIETGDYKLKIQRYTASGNPADDEIEEVNVKIEIKTETPIPTPIAIQIETIVEEIPISTSTIEPTKLTINTPKIEKVLAVTTSKPQETTEIEPIIQSEKTFDIIPVLFFIGIVFVGVGIFPLVRKLIYTNKDVPQNN